MTSTRPMLACNDQVLSQDNYDQIPYPVIVSTKLDGRRNYISLDNKCTSRSGKPLPNIHTRKVIEEAKLIGMDGELLASSPTDPNAMQKAHSAFSSVHGEPDFTYHIFDNISRAKQGYAAYLKTLKQQAKQFPSWAKLIPQVCISTPETLAEFVLACEAEGYEGAVIRSPDSPYKHGRSTWKQGWMLKAKRWTYDEGVVIGLHEAMHNANLTETDELGYTKRSSHKANKIPMNTLGSFEVRFYDPLKERFIEFKISPGGLNAAERKQIWDLRNTDESALNRFITFKHFAQSGVRDKPRHGQFVAFREMTDM